jgi:hypothetical protein
MAIELVVTPDALCFRAGSAGGKSLHLKHAPGGVVPRLDGGRGAEGVISTWRRVGVFTGATGRARFVVLEPADRGEAEIAFGEFYVRGRFRVVEKINNAKRASEAFKAFAPL